MYNFNLCFTEILTQPLQQEPPMMMSFPQPISQTGIQAIIRQHLQNLLQEKSLFNQGQTSDKMTGQNSIASPQGDSKQRTKSLINLENKLQNVIRNKRVQQLEPVSMTSSKVRPEIMQEIWQNPAMSGAENTAPSNNGSQQVDVAGNALENYPQAPGQRAQARGGRNRDQARNQLEQQQPLAPSKTGARNVQQPQKQLSLNEQILEVLRIVTLIRQQQAIQQSQSSLLNYCGSLENLLMCALDMSFCCFDMF